MTKHEKAVPEKKAEEPSWLKEKESGADGALWASAYHNLQAKNHYQKNEGPIPAMTRLQQQGVLSDLSLDDIKKAGHAKAKEELGPHGTLGGHKFYSSSDSVLNDKEQQREVAKLVEKEKAKEKLAQAERLTPTVEKIKEAMTPEIEASLKKNGLETDPKEIKKGMVEAIQSDTMPDGVMQKNFPIMAGYMATGAINGEQRQQILDSQKQERVHWRADHPDAEKGAEFKLFRTGDLLRERFGKERIDAADALLKKLQPAPTTSLTEKR